MDGDSGVPQTKSMAGEIRPGPKGCNYAQLTGIQSFSSQIPEETKLHNV